jgi:hypothetical protein
MAYRKVNFERLKSRRLKKKKKEKKYGYSIFLQLCQLRQFYEYEKA